MNKYEFLLNFALPDPTSNPEDFLDALFEAGCDDATVGVHVRGLIGLDFTRRANEAESALRSAVRDVTRAIPGCFLVQAGPDLVNLADMAEIFGFSRQNMRKYAAGPASDRAAFPVPVIQGDPSLWHLAEIASWLKRNTSVIAPREIVEVAKITAKLNNEADAERIARMQELV